MSGWWDYPASSWPRRRPFEELLEELAERTGQPLWKVIGVTQSSTSGPRVTTAQAVEIAELRRQGVSAEQLAKTYGISLGHIHNVIQRGQAASRRQERAA